MAIAFAGLIGYFAFRPRPKPLRPQEVDIPEPDAPLIQGTTGVVIQMMDRRDPRREAGELSFAGMDPLENEPHMVAVETPKAWLSMRNGWWLRVTATNGKLYMPDRQRPPESGTLFGGVEVLGYKPSGHGDRPSEGAQPDVTFKVASIDFDTLLMQLTTPEEWTLAMPELGASGRGLIWEFNQATQATEFAQVASNLRVKYNPARKGENPAADRPSAPTTPSSTPLASASASASASVTHENSPAAAAPASPAPASPPAPKQVPETLYHLVLEQAVKVEQQQREITGPTMTLWARLLDGQLPPDALPPVRTASDRRKTARTPEAPTTDPIAPTETEAIPVPASSPLSYSPGAQLATAPPAADSRVEPVVPEPLPDQALTIACDGPATLRTLDAAPAELRDDHVAIAMDAKPNFPVRILDPIDGVIASAGQLKYLGTTQRFSMLGEESTPAEVRLVGRGMLQTRQLEADLRNGLIHASGPGLLTGDVGGTERCIRWRGQADLSLLMVDGAIAPALTEAILQEGVVAGEATSSASGEHLVATFAPVEEPPGAAASEARTQLRRVVIRDHATADANETGWLRAGTLIADFEAGANGHSAVPSLVRARDGVVAGSIDGETLHAAELDASMALDDDGRSVVQEAVIVGASPASGASNLALFTRPDGTRAGAPRIIVRPEENHAELIGQNSWIERPGTRLVGEFLRLDGRTRGVEAVGPGELRHNNDARAIAGETDVHATWTGLMAYAESLGRAECLGDVKVTSFPDAWSRDDLSAERVELEFAAAAPEAAPLGSDSTDGSPMDVAARSLTKATAYGSIIDRPEGTNATVRTRRLTPATSPEEAPKEQLTYLEGPELVTNEANATGWVKGAGKLLLVDERPADSASDDQGDSSLRGRTLITWEGSGTVDRAAGRIDLARGATIVHQPLSTGSGSQTVQRDLVLECERATALVEIDGAGDASPTRRGEARGRLRSATATGGAYLRYGPRELTADRIDYDAASGLVRAYAGASPGSLLTFFDQRTGTPQTARSVVWNIRTDSFEVDGPGTLVAPR